MHYLHRLIICLFLVTGMLSLFLTPVFAREDDERNREIIVKYKSHSEEIKKGFRSESVEIKCPIFIKVSPNSGETVNDLLKYYLNDPEVEYAEPNMKWSMQYLPNDPYYPEQWALPKIKLPLAWETTRGNNNVIVAILDTGVDINHPELATCLIDGYNAITDEIGNSYAQDDNGHGTHIAGTICATVNNGIGISGIADHIKIMPVKVLGSDGEGWTDDIVRGIKWAADHNADVINLSLGAVKNSNVIQDAIEYAYSKGVVIVAAAGNTGERGVLYPAALPHVIGVSATDKNDQFYSKSSFGVEVDLSAPGVSIYSTIWERGLSGYNYRTGTSMATSVVSGVAALILSTYPELTNAQVEIALKESAVDLGGLGWDEKYGYGRIDAFEAVRYAKITFIPDHYEARCDINWDGVNNIEDLFLLSRHYGVDKDESVYDLNNDAVIDIYDFIIISRHL